MRGAPGGGGNVEGYLRWLKRTKGVKYKGEKGQIILDT